jgi:hypothetical protein
MSTLFSLTAAFETDDLVYNGASVERRDEKLAGSLSQRLLNRIEKQSLQREEGG